MNIKIKQWAIFTITLLMTVDLYSKSQTFNSDVFHNTEGCLVCKHYSGYYAQKFQDGRVKLGIYLKQKVSLKDLTPLVNKATNLKCGHIKTTEEGKKLEYEYMCSHS